MNRGEQELSTDALGRLVQAWASRVKTRVSSLECYWLNIRKHASGSKIIQLNLIKNNPCTLEDVRVAELIWGPEIEPHAVKGKGTRKKPIPQSQDIVSIPPEVKRVHRDIHLHMDVMWVNGLPFLCWNTLITASPSNTWR